MESERGGQRERNGSVYPVRLLHFVCHRPLGVADAFRKLGSPHETHQQPHAAPISTGSPALVNALQIATAEYCTTTGPITTGSLLSCNTIPHQNLQRA